MVRVGSHAFLVVSSLLLDQDVSDTVNLRELLTVQRGEQLPLTGQGRNELLCQGDGRQTGHITACEGKIVKRKDERLAAFNVKLKQGTTTLILSRLLIDQLIDKLLKKTFEWFKEPSCKQKTQTNP